MCVFVSVWQKASGNSYIYDQPELKRSTLNTVHYTKKKLHIHRYNKKFKTVKNTFFERHVALFFDIQIVEVAITLLNARVILLKDLYLL